MRLWIDDIRPPPPGWWGAKTAEQAIAALEAGLVESVSFDHDLGEGQKDGHDIVCWLEEAVATRGLKPPAVMIVHSDNPVGAKRLRAAIEAIRRLVEKNGGLPESG